MRLWTTILGLLTLLVGSAAGEEITVAAAADMNLVLNELAARFWAKTGHSVRPVLGSSGNLYAQIVNGAPFDLFLSADLDYPQQLEKTGLTEPGTLRVYAIGKLALWVPRDSSLDLSRGIEALLDTRIHQIAIANPSHAPYGRAAVAALRQAGIYDRIAGKLVLGENVSQAAQFVRTGNADIGILALSVTSSPTMNDEGRQVTLPASLYPTLEQAAVVLRSSKKKQTARLFLDFLRDPESRKLLRSYGFSDAGTKAP